MASARASFFSRSPSMAARRFCKSAMWVSAVSRSASSAASAVFSSVICPVMAAFASAASVWLPSSCASVCRVSASCWVYT